MSNETYFPSSFYLVVFINQSLECTEDSMISSDCDQDVFKRINLMFHDPAEEFSQVFHERKMALNREKSQKHMMMELTVWVTPICPNEMKPVKLTET